MRAVKKYLSGELLLEVEPDSIYLDPKTKEVIMTRSPGTFEGVEDFDDEQILQIAEDSKDNCTSPQWLIIEHSTKIEHEIGRLEYTLRSLRKAEKIAAKGIPEYMIR